MTPLTPRELHDPILRALAALTNNTPDEAVPRKQVLEWVSNEIGLAENDPDDIDPKGRSYFNMYTSKAMTEMKAENLTSSPGRGKWAITRNGLIEVGAIDESDESDDLTRTARIEAEEEESVETDDDADFAAMANGEEEGGEEGGEVNDTSSEIPPWADDPYIVTLMQGSTPCFGNYSDRSPACASCPIAVACSRQTLVSFMEIAASLPPGMAEPPVDAPEESTDTEDTPEDPSPVFNSSKEYTTFPVSSECVCCVSGAVIKEGEIAAFIPDQGIVTLKVAENQSRNA